MAGPIQLIGFISKWVNARLIKFIGPTGENKIEIPDNLANALEILEATNSYIKLITTNGSEQIELAKETTLQDNHILEGYTTSRNILRRMAFDFEPGDTAGTNINCTVLSAGSHTYNDLSATSGTDIIKDGIGGSFSLSTDGISITLDVTENVVGIISYDVFIHDLNSSSTSEMYLPRAEIVGNNMNFAEITELKTEVLAANEDCYIADEGYKQCMAEVERLKSCST